RRVGLLQRLQRVPPRGYGGIAQHHGQVAAGEVAQGRDVLRVACRHDDHQLVLREDPRLLDEAGVDELLHRRVVRGGGHVGRRALFHLLHERARPREVVRDVQLRVAGGDAAGGVVERLGERRGGEHRDVALGGRQGGAAGRDEQGDGQEPADAAHLRTIACRCGTPNGGPRWWRGWVRSGPLPADGGRLPTA